MTSDLVDRIRLIRSASIGPVTYRQLIGRFGSARAALDAIPDLARRGGGKPPRLCSAEEAEREAARVEKLGARYLALGQGLYPSLLSQLDDAPPLLIAKGHLALLDRPAVAIVVRATHRRRPAALRGASRTRLGGRASSSSPGLPAESIPRRTTARLKAGR